MNNLDKNMSNGAVVTAVPKAAEIFRQFGIDYCCGGHRILADVIRDQKINEVKIYERLLEAFAKRQEEYKNVGDGYDQMSPAVLSAYIEDTHHDYLRKALPEIGELLDTLVRVHGRNHRELYEMNQLFGRLRTDLEYHLLKEETLLFPELEQAYEHYDEVVRLTDEIISEHEAAGEILRKLREVSKDYMLPEDACNTYRKAFAMLEELEQDLHQHIHLENNILLKSYSGR